MGRKPKGPQADFDVNDVGLNLHFLDSGSFSLWGLAKQWAAEKPGRSEWDYYSTDAMWEYIDDYCAFVKKYQVAIDFFSNVDVIPNPVLTWRNQRYIEDCHHLKPVPVVHLNTNIGWLHHYIENGYDPIALGGLVGSARLPGAAAWLDGCFRVICDTPDRTPRVRIHGFGVTNYKWLFRYPWWSVDSSAWTKAGAYGDVLIPHKRGGKFVFSVEPYMLAFSDTSPDKKVQGQHYLNCSTIEQAIVRSWLDHINVPIGKNDDAGNAVEVGLVNNHSWRKAANLLFFEEMRKSLPLYPWPYRPVRREGFNEKLARLATQ